MIISGGENIHPVEVEEVLARHPLVGDVAVIGEPDEQVGRAGGGLRGAARPWSHRGQPSTATAREAADFAGFKRPRRVVFVKEIPKTASGKILRRLLRDGQYTEIEP